MELAHVLRSTPYRIDESILVFFGIVQLEFSTDFFL